MKNIPDDRPSVVAKCELMLVQLPCGQLFVDVDFSHLGARADKPVNPAALLQGLLALGLVSAGESETFSGSNVFSGSWGWSVDVDAKSFVGRLLSEDQ